MKITSIATKTRYKEKYINLFFLSIFIVIFNEVIDTKNVKAKANKHSKIDNVPNKFVFLFIETISNINPPTIIGILIKKLYSEEFFSSLPSIVSADIVLPDLDSPGTTAKPWTIPTIAADL